MKVYIVKRCDLLEGVFASKKVAMKFIKKTFGFYRPEDIGVVIEEYEVEE